MRITQYIAEVKGCFCTVLCMMFLVGAVEAQTPLATADEVTFERGLAGAGDTILPGDGAGRWKRDGGNVAGRLG